MQWTPKNLVKELKKSVMGQDQYLKDLCTAVYLQELRKECYEKTGKTKCSAQNMLVLGPSGTGKTSTIQELGKILDIPVIIEDASTITGMGWKGRDITEVINDLFAIGVHSETEASFSIVVFDEIDKIFAESNSKYGSFSVVNNLLKFVEGTKVYKKYREEMFCVDTSNMLFIGLGAFDGIEEIIKKRMEIKNKIGFSVKEEKSKTPNTYLDYLKKEDLIEYGMNSQFLGRMAFITKTNPLNEETMKEILLYSDMSIIKQLDAILYHTMQIHVTISDEAAKVIADEVTKEMTGARGLSAKVTEILKTSLYNITSTIDEIRLEYNSLNGIQTKYHKKTVEEKEAIFT